MRRQKSVRVVLDAGNHIIAVISPEDQVVTVELPASFQLLSDEDYFKQIAEIPAKCGIYLDSAGATLVFIDSPQK